MGVLAAVHAAGADVALAAQSLSRLTSPQSRGEQFEIQISNGVFSLIDESYNASPAAMCAALAVLGAYSKPGKSRRIAVLGDMLELGEDTPKLHRNLADTLISSHVDKVYLAGEAMHHLWEALPKNMQGHHCLTAQDLAQVVKATVRPGDIVMVKGSAGSQMGQIVKTLKSMQTTPKKDED